MRKTLSLILAAIALSGCSGQIDMTCDKPRLYQQATETDRVVAPEGFDQLDLSREMPVPSAAAAKPRAPGEPCLDIPPRYLEQLKRDEEERQKKEAEKQGS